MDPGPDPISPPPPFEAPPPLLASTPPPPPAQRMVRVRPADPWAHRRGEPRLFAFLWTVYLLIAVGGSLIWLSRSTVISTSTYGPAARIMLIVVAAGATLLWPMVRLSQASPRGSGLRAALADVVVVLFPMQMILWPLVMLAQWPFGIVAALAAMTTLWVLLIGGIIALALAGPIVRNPTDRGVGERAFWMFICIVLVAAAPSFVLLRRASSQTLPDPPEWVPMLSPFTAIPALTGNGFSGPQRPVSTPQLRGIMAIAVPTAAIWALAVVRRRTVRPAPAPRGGVALESGLD